MSASVVRLSTACRIVRPKVPAPLSMSKVSATTLAWFPVALTVELAALPCAPGPREHRSLEIDEGHGAANGNCGDPDEDCLGSVGLILSSAATMIAPTEPGAADGDVADLRHVVAAHVAASPRSRP